MQPSIILKVKVEHVHDGDTPTVSMTIKFPVRVLGLNCPELSVRDGSGLKAREKAKELLPIGSEVLLEIPTNNPLLLMDSTNLGRILGNIYLSDGSSFAEMMIESGYGHKR